MNKHWSTKERINSLYFIKNINHALLLLLIFTTSAKAQTANPNTLGATLGALIQNIWVPFWKSIFGISFVMGLWMLASGVFTMRAASENGHGNESPRHGLYKIFGGAALISLPAIITIGLNSFGIMSNFTFSPTTVGSVQNCSATSGGITCVAQNIASNMVQPFAEVAFGLMGLIGAFMIVSAIYSVANSAASGHPTKGWVTKIIFGVLLSNTPYLFYLFETTFGLQNGVISSSDYASYSSMLSYTATGGPATLQQYQSLIGYIFQILVMFGIISLWRGIFILKAHAEGERHGGGMGSGLTHIIAGILLANAKWTTCIVINTMFGQGYGFCS